MKCDSIVISVFAIVILSVIGALFKSNHHSMMGSTDDPPVSQGPAVAATVFSAVIVYAVRLPHFLSPDPPESPSLQLKRTVFAVSVLESFC